MEAASIARHADGADAVRRRTCTACGAAVAAGWGEHAEFADERGAGVTERPARADAAAARRARARAGVRPGRSRARRGRARGAAAARSCSRTSRRR